jgi:hypothetical protein
VAALISAKVMVNDPFHADKGRAAQKTRPGWLDQTTAEIEALLAQPPMIFMKGASFTPQSSHEAVRCVKEVAVTAAQVECLPVLKSLEEQNDE